MIEHLDMLPHNDGDFRIILAENALRTFFLLSKMMKLITKT